MIVWEIDDATYWSCWNLDGSRVCPVTGLVLVDAVARPTINSQTTNLGSGFNGP